MVTALLAVVLATFGRAQDAPAQFVDGLQLLARGDFAPAAEALGKAAAGDAQVAVHHLAQAVALIVLEKGAEAKVVLARAASLAPTSGDVAVWSHARMLMFEPGAPAGPPPLQAAPYAPTLIVASLAFGLSPDAGDRAKSKATIEQVAREFAQRQLRDGAAPKVAARPAVDQVRELLEARRFGDVLARLEVLRARQPLDGLLEGYGADARAGLGDFQGAREAYTRALRTLPTVTGYLIGRARCEIRLGALRDAEADLALARRIDSPVAAPSLAEAARLLDAAKSEAAPPASPRLHLRDEQFTRRRCALELDVRAAPGDIEALVALAGFLIEPSAACEIRLGGAITTEIVPCGRPDLARAAEVLALAAKVTPDHPGFLTQSALLERAHGRLDDMMTWIDRALSAGVVDLDLAIAHLDFCAKTANQLDAEAKELRQTRYWEETRRVQDRWVKFPQYRFPTEAEKARAGALDAEAKSLRARAAAPLQEVIRRNAGSNLPRHRVAHHLAMAYVQFWKGELGPALSAAEAAASANPHDLRTLRFLAAAYAKAGRAADAASCQQTLRELAGDVATSR